jgi:hypothetical protein
MEDVGTQPAVPGGAMGSAVWLRVAYPLVLTLAVRATPSAGVDSAAVGADGGERHHYFPGRLITRTGCALGSVLIGLAGLGGGFLIAIVYPLQASSWRGSAIGSPRAAGNSARCSQSRCSSSIMREKLTGCRPSRSAPVRPPSRSVAAAAVEPESSQATSAASSLSPSRARASCSIAS